MPTLIKVSEKGQILIPISIRKALNIKTEGQVVVYPLNEEKLIIEAAGDNPIDTACGLLADAGDNENWSKELLDERKKDRKKEEAGR